MPATVMGKSFAGWKLYKTRKGKTGQFDCADRSPDKIFSRQKMMVRMRYKICSQANGFHYHIVIHLYLMHAYLIWWAIRAISGTLTEFPACLYREPSEISGSLISINPWSLKHSSVVSLRLPILSRMRWLVRKEFCALSEMCHSLSPLRCQGKQCSQSSIFLGPVSLRRINRH